MEKLFTISWANKGEYVSAKSISTLNKYFMAFESKPESIFPATLNYKGSIGVYHVYSVDIKVCGKVQSAVRKDNIYLFETIYEYNKWSTEKRKESNNMSKEIKEKEPQSIWDVFLNELAGYYRDYAARYDGYDRIWKRINEISKEPTFETSPVVGGNIKICITPAGTTYNQVVLAQDAANTYTIDGTEVSKEAFDNAVDVAVHGDNVQAVLNSVRDILKEYNTAKKEAEEQAEKAAKAAAKAAELKEIIAKAQKELNELTKERGK